VAGVAGAATARTTTVNRREQEHLAALHDAPAVEVDPVAEEPIAKGVPLAPTQRPVAADPAHHVVVEQLTGTLVDVVRTTATNRGRSCPRHSCCGMQVAEKCLSRTA